jgi:hypothetical protein
MTIDEKHCSTDDPAFVKGSVPESEPERRAEQQARVDEWDNWKSVRDVA